MVEAKTDFLNKLIIVYFDDGEKVIRKEGLLKEITSNYILLSEPNKPAQMIFNNRLIRIEEGGKFDASKK